MEPQYCKNCKHFSFIEYEDTTDDTWGECDSEERPKLMDIGDAKFLPHKDFKCCFYE